MELVTGAMGSLLPKLGELLKEKYNLQRGVKAQVQSLSRELEIMHAALRKVAEVPREQLDEQVKLWARNIRELSYDMEDIVDTFLVRVEDGREATPNPHRLKKLMEKMGDLFNEGKARRHIAVAIQDINKQIQEMANKYGRYAADNIVAMPAASTPIDPRLQALHREATELVGIDGKRVQELIEMLSEGDDVSKKKLKIVSVVGFGGLGKTTLVRAVCDKIKGDFDCWAFVSVGRRLPASGRPPQLPPPPAPPASAPPASPPAPARLRPHPPRRASGLRPPSCLLLLLGCSRVQIWRAAALGAMVYWIWVLGSRCDSALLCIS